MSLLQLMWTFFYIGLFTIGGGQVAITLMYQPVVEGGLLSADQFYNMVAVSESTPGPIGINMATYIGCELFVLFKLFDRLFIKIVKVDTTSRSDFSGTSGIFVLLTAFGIGTVAPVQIVICD